jgi:hypothetical protein
MAEPGSCVPAMTGPRPPGRILRLRLGLNPNSSSIGTIVFAMPAALLGLTVAFGAAAGLLSSAFAQRAASSDEDAVATKSNDNEPRAASKP